MLVSTAGNQIFKKSLIELAPKGCLNFHTALLPKYRGLMTSFWVLNNNETHTGVYVFFVDAGIDSCPILVQKKVNIGKRAQQEYLKYTKWLVMDAINEAVEMIQKGDYDLISNHLEGSSYFSFPTKKDVQEFKRIGKKFFRMIM